MFTRIILRSLIFFIAMSSAVLILSKERSVNVQAFRWPSYVMTFAPA